MAKQKEYDFKPGYKPYNTDIRPGESIEKYYTRLAKVADQRLVRIEQLSGQENFKGIDKFAYAKAKKALDVWGGTRFNTKMPESVNLRNEKIADMIHFLQSPTSTKAGIVDIYKRRAETIKKDYGIDMNWQDMGKLMEAFSDDDSGGSPTKVKALGVIKQIDTNGVTATLEKNPNLSDEIIRDVAAKYLNNSDFDNIIDKLKLKTDKSVLLQIIEGIK